MKIKRSLVCAIALGILLPLATPVSAVGSRRSAAAGAEHAASEALPSWDLASWLGGLLMAMWGQDRGYIDPGSSAPSSATIFNSTDSTPTY